MEIIVKSSRQRVDPKAPHTNPDYQMALSKGKIAARDLKFESEGDRRDYERAVKANPNNVYGLPPFFPPEKIRLMLNDVCAKEFIDERRVELERIRLFQLRTVHVLCDVCREETRHNVSPEQTFCSKCGTQKHFH